MTPERDSVNWALARTKSLRPLSADYSVSYETIRAVVRQEPVNVEHFPRDRVSRVSWCSAAFNDRPSPPQG